MVDKDCPNFIKNEIGKYWDYPNFVIFTYRAVGAVLIFIFFS